jgi:hypothetical protein
MPDETEKDPMTEQVYVRLSSTLSVLKTWISLARLVVTNTVEATKVYLQANS